MTTKLSDAKKKANKKWDDKNKEKKRLYQYRSYAKKYVRELASKDDLLELKAMIDERLRDSRGQKNYIEAIGDRKLTNNKSQRKIDARLHVIYENGTKNTPLLNGLASSMYSRNGKIVTEPNDDFKLSNDDQVISMSLNMKVIIQK